MASIASVPGSKVEGPVDNGGIGAAAAVRAFREVSSAIAQDVETRELFRLIARRLAELVGDGRASLYLLDESSDLFRGYAGSWPEHDERIKRLTCGGPADRMTPEIVATKAPVYIADAQNDPRVVRSTMRAWDIRSLLGVPLVINDEVIGLLFLDTEDSRHVYSAEDQQLAMAFADLAALAMMQRIQADELRRNVLAVAQQNKVLRQATAMEERILDVALADGTYAGILAELSQYLEKPCALYDTDYRQVAVADRPGTTVGPPRLLMPDVRDRPAVREALTVALADGRPRVVDPLPEVQITHRSLLVPIMAGGRNWGHLVVLEYGRRFTPLDTLAARRATSVIAMKSAMQQSTGAELTSRDRMVRDILDASGAPDVLTRHAEALGIPLHAPQAIALVRHADGTPIPASGVADTARALGLGEVWPARCDDGAVAILLPLPTDVAGLPALLNLREPLTELARDLGSSGPVHVAVSSMCMGLAEIALSFSESADLLASVERLGGGAGDGVTLVLADELGPGRLLLSGLDHAQATRFLTATLGPLLEDGGGRNSALMDTLNAYFAAGRMVREAAEQMHVHENTVRYRLGRIQELTGLDVVANADHQFHVQVALLIARLTGRQP